MAFIDEKYFKEDGENILFVGPYMEAYIPFSYFDRKYAQEIGDTIKVFGLFNIRTFNDSEGKSANPPRLFNVPIQLMTYPTSYEIKNIDIQNIHGPHAVLKYYNGDIFCPSAVPKNLLAFEQFLSILTNGKIPASVSYEDIIEIWKNNIEVGDIGFDIEDSIIELVICEIYRSSENPINRFGKVLGKEPNHSPYDYITASPREITKFNSTFTGITFENMDEMLAASVTRSKDNIPENKSPMEEVIKY